MLKVKKVQLDDFHDIVNMLQSISKYTPSNEDIDEIWNKFSHQKNLNGFSFFLNNKIIGYGSILYETKIRGGIAGHIEDIVINHEYRGNGFGLFIINYLKEDAIKNKCYKVSLSCKEQNIEFYKKCGFNLDGVTMQIQF